MPITTVSAVQMRCVEDPTENLAHAESLVRQAATKGAQIILLPELFERPYFCQERRYEYYSYAAPVSKIPLCSVCALWRQNWALCCPSAFMRPTVRGCLTPSP